MYNLNRITLSIERIAKYVQETQEISRHHIAQLISQLTDEVFNAEASLKTLKLERDFIQKLIDDFIEEKNG